MGELTGDELFGRSSLALTYGVPTIHAALLLQAGLPSRTMAVTLDESYPASSASIARFPRWLTSTISRFDESEEWVDDVDKEIWKDFVAQWREVGIRNWTHAEVTLEVPVKYGSGTAKTDVFLVHDNGNVVVADAEFRKRAEVAHKRASLLCKFGTATLQGNTVTIDYFGPPIE